MSTDLSDTSDISEGSGVGSRLTGVVCTVLKTESFLGVNVVPVVNGATSKPSMFCRSNLIGFGFRGDNCRAGRGLGIGDWKQLLRGCGEAPKIKISNIVFLPISQLCAIGHFGVCGRGDTNWGGGRIWDNCTLCCS